MMMNVRQNGRTRLRHINYSETSEQRTHWGRTLVRCREVVPISDVDKLATPPILSSLVGFMQRGVAYKKLNQQVSIKHALHGQKPTKQIKEWRDYLLAR